MKPKIIFKLCQPLLSLIVVSILFLTIQDRLSELGYQQIVLSLRSIQQQNIFWAIILALVGYLVIATYDIIALRHLNYRLDLFKCISTAFSSYSISNNTGFALFVGGGIRYYFYRYYGVPNQVIAQVILMSNFNFWLGFLSLGGITFSLNPIEVPSILQSNILNVRPVGLILLGLLVLYFYCSCQQKSLGFRGIKLRFPAWQVSRDLIAVALLDRAIASLVLFILLPQQTTINYGEFFGIYFLAIHAGIMSHIPGGIGVFEAVIIYFLTQSIDAREIIGSLLAFRAIYYFLPLLMGCMWIVIHELRQNNLFD